MDKRTDTRCDAREKAPASANPLEALRQAQAAPPPHPDDLRRSQTRRAIRKRKSFARFFTRQLLLFGACALLIVTVDLLLYVAIAIHESDALVNEGTPGNVVRTVSEGLALDAAGAYELAPQAAATLEGNGAWAMLVGPDGSALWSRDLPPDAPDAFSLNDVALAAHYASVADRPAFFWSRDDGLLVVGFPANSYWNLNITYPADAGAKLPLYALLIFVVDAAMLFLLYAMTKRRTQNAVGPLADALDQLAKGRSVDVHLKGDLREVGERLREVSALIERKDAARASWIRGVSHDIRTPLSMILGHADVVASDGTLPADARASAAVIREQGLKIRDLVTDLNAAAQLDYDMQPLRLERVHLPRLLRTVVAAHVNGGLDKLHPLRLEVADDAAEAVVLGDERLLTRAVENAVANARLHNERGCAVKVELIEESAASDAQLAVIRVSDNGAGVSAAGLAALEARLDRARAWRADASASSDEHGLGLVLIDRIARAHGGALALSGTEGEGFTVEMSLPLA